MGYLLSTVIKTQAWGTGGWGGGLFSRGKPATRESSEVNLTGDGFRQFAFLDIYICFLPRLQNLCVFTEEPLFDSSTIEPLLCCVTIHGH